ncbi:hypothetical protein ANN_01143 [Periplaneta americana]|uniref:Uncharacterized protein n=1 Tax=Periplaneta americana TaxID=6978 RepID=A0ABQ8TSR6_PERAM|nr:hypothetical protein ANN_01143 [Periplaneta americana]
MRKVLRFTCHSIFYDNSCDRIQHRRYFKQMATQNEPNRIDDYEDLTIKILLRCDSNSTLYSVSTVKVELNISMSPPFLLITLYGPSNDVRPSLYHSSQFLVCCLLRRSELPTLPIRARQRGMHRTDRLDTATYTHTLLSTDVHIRTDHVRYTLRYLHCFSVVSCPHPSDSALNGILYLFTISDFCADGPINSFHRPHTDTCNTCDTFSVRIAHEKDEQFLAQLKMEQELHLRRLQNATEQKKIYKEKSEQEYSLAVFTLDLENVGSTFTHQQQSLLTESSLTYNFGIHNLKTGKYTCSCGGENTASRGSQEIGSCLKKYCKGLHEVSLIIAYSDCCGGQDRNKNLFKFWMYIMKTSSIQVIDHKFLEPGHTYTECDQDFGLIKNSKYVVNNIFVPEDWISTVKATSKKFSVTPMSNEDFFTVINVIIVIQILKPYFTLSYFFTVKSMDKFTKTTITKDEEDNTLSWHKIR